MQSDELMNERVGCLPIGCNKVHRRFIRKYIKDLPGPSPR